MSPIFVPPDYFLCVCVCGVGGGGGAGELAGGTNEGYFLPAKVANNRTVSRIVGSADSWRINDEIITKAKNFLSDKQNSEYRTAKAILYCN